MNFQATFYVTGCVLLALGVFMLAPMALDFINDEPTYMEFLKSACITLFTGALFAIANRPAGAMVLTLRGTFVMTTFSWISLSLFSTIPFLLTPMTTNHTDSFFETISALTTTGATAMTGLDFMPLGILLWRSLLQWLGGIGIIVTAITVLPILRIGGMQLFRSEFSDKTDKIHPRVSHITRLIFYVYTGMTLLCTVLLWFSGMSFFEAFCHACCSVSTGGMSTSDASIARFNSLSIEIVIMIFMILGSLPLILFVRMFRGDLKSIFKDQQVRLYLLIVSFLPFLVHLWRWYFKKEPFFKSLRETYFNMISSATTTGFTTVEYSDWGTFPLIIMMALWFMGGCTGSTAGGLKMLRIRITVAMLRAHLLTMFQPHAVHVPMYNRNQIPDNAFASVFVFSAIFATSFFTISLLLGLCGLDFITAVSGALTSLTNFGPGIGPIIGPSGNFSLIGNNTKWVMMIAMILGRLEFITIIILLVPQFWRD